MTEETDKDQGLTRDRQAQLPADTEPAIGESVLVEVNGVRCMAYRDLQGQWRDYFYQRELNGRIRVIPTYPAFEEPE